MRRLAPLTLLFALGLFAASVSLASAETYPGSVGSLQATASQGAAGTGQNVSVQCKATGTNGAPLAGADCTISVVSEPGGANGDVTVGSKTRTLATDASGNAVFTVFTGSTPGILTLRLRSDTLESQLSI